MNTNGSLLLLGGGGHAAVVAEAAQSGGFQVAGFLDDVTDVETVDSIPGLQRLGSITQLKTILAGLGTHCKVHAAIGNANTRSEWIDRIRCEVGIERLVWIVHPDSTLSSSARLQPGVFIAPRAVINARASIGIGSIINTGAIVEHDCCIGEMSHLAGGSILGGNVSVGRGCLIGLGAIVLPGMRIGDDVTLGAGAVATSDIPSGVTALGVPAKILCPAH